MNLLTKREFGGSSQTPLRIDLTYTDRDQLATATRYSDLAGTTKIGSSTFTYDSTGRLENLKHYNGSSSLLANFTYSYDVGSRLTSDVTNGTTTTYGYDTTNQLTNDGATTFSYDANGNRTMTGYQTGTANRLSNDGTYTYTYDAEGNLTKKSKGGSLETWTFGYDHWNHMTWAEKRASDGGTLQMRSDYKYDVFGNRIEKAVDADGAGSGGTTTTRFAYDGTDIWADLDGSSSLQTRYLRGDVVDQLFARISSGGTAAWYLTDRLGSVRNLVDASGTLINTLTYDAWGTVLSESSPSNGDRWKWTGRELDSETGLQFNRGRYLQNATGRWTTEDPIRFAAGDANLNRYVVNVPTNATDPTGLVAWVGAEGDDKLKPNDKLTPALKEHSNSRLDRVTQILNRTRAGRAALEFLRKHKIKVSLVERIERRRMVGGAWERPTRLAGYTAGDGGTIFLGDDQSDDDLAGTLVHEAQHASDILDGRPATEHAARLEEIRFYVELGWDRIYDPYKRDGWVRRRADGKIVIDEDKIRKEVPGKYPGPGPTVQDEKRDHGKWEFKWGW